MLWKQALLRRQLQQQQLLIRMQKSSQSGLVRTRMPAFATITTTSSTSTVTNHPTKSSILSNATTWRSSLSSSLSPLRCNNHASKDHHHQQQQYSRSFASSPTRGAPSGGSGSTPHNSMHQKALQALSKRNAESSTSSPSGFGSSTDGSAPTKTTVVRNSVLHDDARDEDILLVDDIPTPPTTTTRTINDMPPQEPTFSSSSSSSFQQQQQQQTNTEIPKESSSSHPTVHVVQPPPPQQQQQQSLYTPQPPPSLSALGQLHEFAPRIVVAGVGGAGGNALNNMIAKDLKGVEFLALNTDAQHLSTTLTDQRLQLGVALTKGLGCGANPDAGRLAAEECRDEIANLLQDSHMLFITAGMGGGTGTGAAPVVAEIGYDMGILTVAVVTLPFRFEGTYRRRLAMEGIARLQNVVDTLIVIPNQNLFQMATPETSFVDAFSMADNVLLSGVKSITDLMTSPGLINLDFADVQSVMHGMGNALLGTGEASGEDRSVHASQLALDNPLLGSDLDISTAKGMLVNITGGPDMTLFEVDKAAQYITERVNDDNANIIFGSAYDETLKGAIRVSVVATGIDAAAASSSSSSGGGSSSTS